MRLETGRQAGDYVAGAGAPDRCHHRRLVVEARHISEADGLAYAELEAKEVLKRAGQTRSPFVSGHSRERRVVDENRARRWLVHLGEQLDQRRLAGAVLTDDGYDRAGGQQHRDLVEDQARRARVGERHLLEADAPTQGRGDGQVSRCDERRGVVFEPREAPRAVHPKPAKESNLADCRADVRRQARSGREHEQHGAGWRAETN